METQMKRQDDAKQPRKRTDKEMIDRASEPDWYGISDEVLKRMIANGQIKDKLPPNMKKRLGV